ncbi:hypothetical protein [Sporomusa sp.]|uniref:hypothetical protein n=1 Tax=Sporomusa sp. TaxID=2078658 RepID=UPI002B8C1822|nr:hypothetical protein [Sporomusa sp.]HWR06680.1 hypothetical protein [Sporomusa sp.]
MGKIVSIAVLKSILNKAFEQYVFDRVDNILGTANNVNPKYCKATATVGSVLAELMAIASALEEQRPKLLRLVMDFESAATYESALQLKLFIERVCGLAAESGRSSALLFWRKQPYNGSGFYFLRL